MVVLIGRMAVVIMVVVVVVVKLVVSIKPPTTTNTTGQNKKNCTSQHNEIMEGLSSQGHSNNYLYDLYHPTKIVEVVVVVVTTLIGGAMILSLWKYNICGRVAQLCYGWLLALVYLFPVAIICSRHS